MENGIGVLGNLVPPTWWKAVLAVLVVLLAVFVGRFGGRFLSWVAALALKDRERRYAAWAQRIWWGVVGVAAFSFLVNAYGWALEPFRTWGRQLAAWAGGNGLSVLFILALTYLGYRLVERFMERLELPVGEEHTRQAVRAQTLKAVIESTLKVVVVLIGALLALANLNLNVTALIAGVGVAGLAVSFAAQNLIRDVINGFFIILEDQYGVGDIIQVGGTAGLVEKMNLRLTVLRDLEGRVHFIPNGQVDQVTVFSHGWARAVVDVGVAYKENIDRVLEVIGDEARRFYEDPAWRERFTDEPPQVLGVNVQHQAPGAVGGGARVPPPHQEPPGRRGDRDSLPAPHGVLGRAARHAGGGAARVKWFGGVLALALLGWAAAGPGLFVPTTEGPVRGGFDPAHNVLYFRGIPYAKAERWKPPAPPPAHERPLDARAPGPACPQRGVVTARLGGFLPEQSEDCLNLNIWTPALPPPPEGWPVLVFLHGGSFTGGSGSEAVYDGTQLAARGVVVVTLNYRLGPLGFLALPALAAEDPHGSTGNYGLLDQIAALKWIRANIRAFGGNPDNITLFGQSAGGMSVCTLMASPLAQGLFHKAIIQSGGCVYVRTLEEGYRDAARLAEAVGCALEDLACWRALPVQTLLEIFPEEVTGEVFLQSPYKPHLDGYVLDRPPLEALREGRAAGVPLLAGANADERRLELVAFVLGPRAWSAFQKRLQTSLPEGWEAVFARYRTRFEDPLEAYFAYQTERVLFCPSLEAARAQAAHAPSYAYVLTYRSPLFAELGSFHGLDLPLLFGTHLVWPFWSLFATADAYREARRVTETMQRFWVAFARTGVPRSGWLEAPRVGSGFVLRLDVRSGWMPDPYPERCLWRQSLEDGTR